MSKPSCWIRVDLSAFTSEQNPTSPQEVRDSQSDSVVGGRAFASAATPSSPIAGLPLICTSRQSGGRGPTSEGSTRTNIAVVGLVDLDSALQNLVMPNQTEP
jgi:hypothetical protein